MNEPIYLFKIELSHIKPKIWREFYVPANISLAVFHGVIQCVMGWHDAHVHEFTINKERYQECPDPDFPAESTYDYRLTDFLPSQTKTIRYIYDFGDDWEHVIKLVKADFSPPEGFPEHYGCLRGARACPPEDIGGPYGYSNFLEILNDPGRPEYADMKEWYGNLFDAENPFDGERFDVGEVNGCLAGIRPPKSPRKAGGKTK